MARIILAALALIFASSIATAQSAYKIRTGDVLRVEVLEDASLNRDLLVLPDGTISVPQVGSIRASGQTIGAVKATIVAGLSVNFASPPTVFVSVRTVGKRVATSSGRSTIDVFIMGAVTNPGKAQVNRGTSLLQFLAESGGFTKFAAKKRIQLRRTNSATGESNVYKFNYQAVESGRASGNTIILQPGDVIVVPERGLFE